MLLDGNPKGYEVAEHISTNVEANPRIISMSKKIHLKHETGVKFLDIIGWKSGNFSCIGQEKNMAVLFQARDILW